MRILIRCPNPIGDAVMATPAFRAIRDGFPSTRITFLARAPVDEVLSGAPWYDEFWTTAKADSPWDVARRIRMGRFDLAVLFPNSFGSALEAFLGGARRRVGYAMHFRRFLLTDPLRRKELDTVRSYLDLIKPLGLDVPKPKLELFVTEEQERQASEFLKSHGVGEGEKLIIIVPGAAYGPAKLWLNDRWAEVADALAEQSGAKIILTGSAAEVGISGDIARQMKTKPINAASEGMRLGVLKALVRRSTLLLSTDTGPRHFAVAFGVPSVVIFGPTDPKRTESCCENVTIIRQDLPCSPCQLRTCPIDHRCMTALDASVIIDAVMKKKDDRET